MRRGAVLLLLFVGCAVSRPMDAPDASVPLEDVDAGDCLAIPDIDFGEVPVGNQRSKHLVFRSPPDASVLALVGGLDAPFTVAPQGVFEIDPTQPLEVDVAFEPLDGILHLGEFELTIGTSCSPQRVKVRGLGGGSVDFPSAFDFGPTALGATTAKSMRITNTQRVDAQLTLTTTAFSPMSAFSAPSSVVVPAHGVVEVPISVTVSALGLVVGTLSIDGAGPRRDVSLSAMGGFPEPELDRTVVDLGLVGFSGAVGPNLEPSAETFVVLRNVGGGVLSLSNPAVSIVVDGGAGLGELQVEVPAFPLLQPGEASLIDVRFFARSLGPRAWRVELGTQPPVAFDVRANVVSLPACVVSWAPATLWLGTGSVGQPATATIAITNLGTTDCFVDDIFVNPLGEWQLVSPAEMVIAPGATAPIEATVTPRGAGPHLETIFFRPFRGSGPGEAVNLELDVN